MIRRLTVFFGLVAFPAALFTSAGYVLATRKPGPYQRAFEGQWDAIAAGFAVTVCGVLAVVYGVRLCFSVLGGFQPDNVRRVCWPCSPDCSSAVWGCCCSGGCWHPEGTPTGPERTVVGVVRAGDHEGDPQQNGVALW